MKKFRFFFLTMAVLLVMCLSFTACGEKEPTYTVWVKDFNFSSSDADYGRLADGTYRVIVLTNSSFEWQRDNNYAPKGASKKNWTVDQIASQLVSWGFSKSIARDAADELASYSHSELGLRKGAKLYCILK